MFLWENSSLSSTWARVTSVKSRSDPKFLKQISGRDRDLAKSAVSGRDRVDHCTLGKALYNFAGNERRQELFMTQALESD